MLYIGYSTIVGSVSSLHHLVTTSTVSTVTTISTMVASVTEYIGTGFLANLYTSVGYYGNMVSSALYTTTQMLAVLIWTPVAAITSWAYYGNQHRPIASYQLGHNVLCTFQSKCFVNDHIIQLFEQCNKYSSKNLIGTFCKNSNPNVL